MYNLLALVTFRIYPTLMGGQKGVANFYQFLKDHCNVTLIASEDNETRNPSVFNLLYRNKFIIFNLLKIRKITSIALKNKVDVIFSEHSYPAFLAYFIHKHSGLPFVIHSHNLEYKRFREMNRWWWRLYFWYERWIHQKANFNFFISEEDRLEAIEMFHLQPAATSVATYGIEKKPIMDKNEARKLLGLDKRKRIFLFNGTLDYKPNLDAVLTIIREINKVLSNRLADYHIIITGNRATSDLIEIIKKERNLTFLGYVDNIDLYYQSADLFINPVINNTGVKTKVIEAIANNCTTISTVSGAAGIRHEVCANKLIVCPDQDWNNFTEQILMHMDDHNENTTDMFYKIYSWKNIVSEVNEQVEKLIKIK